MKMNYLRTREYNFRNEGNGGFWKPFAFVLLVVGLYLWGAGLFVELFSVITYPYLRLSGQISSSLSDAIKERKFLIAENHRLNSENERLRVTAALVEELKKQNEDLRGFTASSDQAAGAVYARVLVKPDHLPYDEIIIDAGRDNNPLLRPGQLVFAAPGVILGQIETVTGKFSRVKLYSEGGVSLPVNIGSELIPGIALGLGSGNFSLSLPRGVKVAVGDPVKTSIVGDFVLGYIAKIEKDPNDPFQKITFRSPYNIFNLEWIFIVP